MDQNETNEVVMSQSAHDALMEKQKAEGEAAAKAAKADGVAEGRKAERERLAAILADDKVKGRELTAINLALQSPDMAAAAVVAFVATLPATAPATIEQRMQGQGADLALGQPMRQPNAGQGGWGKAVASVNKSRGFAA